MSKIEYKISVPNQKVLEGEELKAYLSEIVNPQTGETREQYYFKSLKIVPTKLILQEPSDEEAIRLKDQTLQQRHSVSNNTARNSAVHIYNGQLID